VPSVVVSRILVGLRGGGRKGVDAKLLRGAPYLYCLPFSRQGMSIKSMVRDVFSKFLNILLTSLGVVAAPFSPGQVTHARQT